MLKPSLASALILSGLTGLAAAGVVQTIPGFSVTYPAGKIGGSSATGIPKDFISIPAAKEYYLDYEVMFASDWEWNLGGKLPGLVGGTHTTGCASIVPDGWSARFMWSGGGQGNLYLYHQNRQSGCGDYFAFSRPGDFVMGQWNRITEHVVINTPGLKDGVVEAWYNGVKKVSLTDVELRGKVTAATALVDAVSLQTFYGGSSLSWAPSHTTHSQFSDFYVRDDSPDLSRPFASASVSLRPAAGAAREADGGRAISWLGNGNVTLPSGLRRTGRVDLVTPQGRLVRSLSPSEAARWDGLDAAGAPVPAGILLAMPR